MRLVLDASIVLPLMGFDTAEAAELRSWIDELLDGDTAHIIRTLTPLEVTSALRRLEASGEIGTDHAATVQRRIFGWPFVRAEVTQPMLERIWELRHNFTPYDAAYLAATETLQAQHLEELPLGRGRIAPEPGSRRRRPHRPRAMRAVGSQIMNPFASYGYAN